VLPRAGYGAGGTQVTQPQLSPVGAGAPGVSPDGQGPQVVPQLPPHRPPSVDITHAPTIDQSPQPSPTVAEPQPQSPPQTMYQPTTQSTYQPTTTTDQPFKPKLKEDLFEPVDEGGDYQ
jgi:hypothetical protein